MRLLKKGFCLSVGAVLVCLGLMAPYAKADNLSAKKNLLKQLQGQSSQNQQAISGERAKSETLQESIQSYQTLINNVSHQITTNENQLNTAEQKLNQLHIELQQTQAKLQKAEDEYGQMVRATYEDGSVSYLAVLFSSTSFSDMISRLNSLSTITDTERKLEMQILQLKTNLNHQQVEAKATYQTLQRKRSDLQALKRVDESLQTRKQQALSVSQQTISYDTIKGQQFQRRMRLTSGQIQQMEQQIQQSVHVISTGAGNVTVPELRYQAISATALYNYVQARGSTFTVGDIETICNAAQQYDINPALLIAITGQEQAFVPSGPDAAQIRNNPFNVFFSWQVYNTTLGASAGIAADTLRHKLSVAPPAGESPIQWINDPHNPWGIYATDPNWANGVQQVFNNIMSTVQ